METSSNTLRSFLASVIRKYETLFLLDLKFGNSSKLPPSTPNLVRLKEELGWHLKVCSGISSKIKRRKNTITDTRRSFFVPSSWMR
jgi:hypothetical protein